MPAVKKPTLSAAQAERLWRLVQALRSAAIMWDTAQGCDCIEYVRRKTALDEAMSKLRRFCVRVESRRESRGR